MMKKYLSLLIFLPFASMAQKSKAPVKPKKAPVKVEAAEPRPVKPADGYLIIGNIKGYPDGTTISLLNGNNGVPEATTQIAKDKFTFTGKAEIPDFKLVAVNNKAPYLTLFLDNSLINITGSSDNFETALVKGSPSHEEFVVFNNMIKPYLALFGPEGSPDTLLKKDASRALISFVKKYPNSYISPLAIYRNYQAVPDTEVMDELFSTLPEPVKQGPIGKYLSQQLADLKRNPIGKPLADFSQADSEGRMISLSSLRGKYVLIDFWASWCGPCRQENPNVVATYHRYKDKNYTVLGVSFDKAKPAWIDAIKMDNLDWTHVSDLQGWGNAVGQQFQIQQIPQNFLVDPNGILIAKNLRGPALASKLASLFGN